VSSILIPNPFDSDKEYQRYHHYDLADMETEDLLCELGSTRYRLWLLKYGRFARVFSSFEQRQRLKWYRERISRIKVELGKRRYVPRETRSQPKPKLSQGVKL